MPIPLIAAALIAAGVSSGGGGLALGGKGARDIKRARSRIKTAEAGYQRRAREDGHSRRFYEPAAERIWRATEGRADRGRPSNGDFLRRHAKQVRESERLLVDGIDATVGSVTGAASLDADAARWAMGIVTSGMAGAGVASGVTTAAATFGVASTGAAISGLSGAAAESATLAFLGGGSLASGGGGMALGATALNFVTVGPALLVGGFVINGQGQKALTQARKYEAQVAVGIADLSELATKLSAVRSRVDELSGLLQRLAELAVGALDLLESEEFDPEAHAPRFQRALNLVMAVRDIGATPVVDGAGEVNEKASSLSVKYKSMAEESVMTSEKPLRGEIVGKRQGPRRASPGCAQCAHLDRRHCARVLRDSPGRVDKACASRHVRGNRGSEDQGCRGRLAAILRPGLRRASRRIRGVVRKARPGDRVGRRHDCSRSASRIVDIAQSSPLADLGDLSQIRKALDDPNQVWDL